MVLEPSARIVDRRSSDNNAKIGEMVKLITKYGPHISRIAREMQVHKETVRYWYKGLMKKGLATQAIPNHEKLGLKRIVALVEFSEEFRPYADAILMSMNELSYLSSFIKTIPEDLFSIQASVPEEFVGAWIEYMYALKERGLFSSIQVFPFEWVRVVPMRSEMYDFESGSWQYDWASKPRANPSDFAPAAKGRFDFVDLNIIKQLQINPDASLIEISEKLGVNYKTLNWHARMHVVRRGLLKGYSVNWAGTRYDPKVGRALHRRHRYMWVELLVSNVTTNERMELMANMSRLPYVWLEASGGQNYFTQIAFPMETMTEALEFIKEVISPVKRKAVFHFMDQADALRFSMGLELYDEEENKWKFNQDELLRKFDKLVLEIKGMAS